MGSIDDRQAELVGDALFTVASAGGKMPLSAADRDAIASALRTVFGRPDHCDVPALQSTTSTHVANALDHSIAHGLVEALAVMAFVDGVVEQAKLELVVDFATALRSRAPFVDDIHQLSLDHVAWVAHDTIRANVATIPGVPWRRDDPYGPFLPYQGAAVDEDLTRRYARLHDLPEDTFGWHWAQHYLVNDYAFPGSETAIVEAWATPHDSLHVLSGYSTSAQGEILVAAFTGAAFAGPVDFMVSHVLPTILIYHLGIDINKGLNQGDADRAAADPTWRDNYSGNVHLGLDAAKLWVARQRGRAMNCDVYSGHWDFWADVPLDELRALRDPAARAGRRGRGRRRHRPGRVRARRRTATAGRDGCAGTGPAARRSRQKVKYRMMTKAGMSTSV